MEDLVEVPSGDTSMTLTSIPVDESTKIITSNYVENRIASLVCNG